MDSKIVLFNRKDSEIFFKTLNKRVNNYFKEKNIVREVQKMFAMKLSFYTANTIAVIFHLLTTI